jgi:hypothetical protein
MNPVMLWLFFVLDRVILVFDNIFVASVIYCIVAFLIWAVGCGITDDEYDNEKKKQKRWKDGFKKATRPYTIMVIVLLPVSLFVSVLLPNTKEAVAIVVVPKILKYASNSPELKKIPNNFMKMTNGFMEKKISEWARDLKLNSNDSVAQIDSTVALLTKKLEEAKKAKEAIGKALE